MRASIHKREIRPQILAGETMSGKLRFAVTALTWAMILLAIYALTARAQTGATQLRAKSGLAAQAGPPACLCLGGSAPAKRLLHARVSARISRIANSKPPISEGSKPPSGKALVN
jgi:hypothetical protein